MRLLRRVTAASALVAAVALAGCTTPTEDPPESPKPSAAPVFASEEEALAAAEEAYTAYLAMSDEIATGGGKDPERMRGLVTADQFEEEIASFAMYSERALRLSGSSSFRNFRLQQLHQEGGRVDIAAYACLDVSGTRLVDEEGQDKTPNPRPDLVPLELRFENAGAPPKLLLAASDVWEGGGVC
ncbi:hypothetical protein CLV46_1195 [Diaminobutyricimonas aerilata]|uniref:Lipoprotein n=1 Tax=Diaminobutyricimonas aerilata TaxID=1162967 RepID=A0A2M9CIA1_9MICO|nr:hypothetical protein [Diaminobutyricimonas aerilata]PJJ71644.1 hypothetical protein CLV46_1195 [Diaminobutyricimonas aerilata]